MRSRRKLLIVGAGDFGREVLETALEVPPEMRDWEVAGFLDGNPKAAVRQLADSRFDWPVLGTPDEYEIQPEDCFVCSIASTESKLRVAEGLVARGAEFVNVVHPTAIISPSSTLGRGTVLRHHSSVSSNANVGSFVALNSYAAVGHDAIVGDGCTISSFCDIMGYAQLERGAFLGSHAAILPKSRVGEFATVGAGSVVVRRVAAGRTVFGVPAQYI